MGSVVASGRVGRGPAASVVGVDIGGTKLLAVALEATGEIAAEVQVPAPSSTGVAVSVTAAVREVTGGREPDAVGVGLPALVDRSGVVRFSAHLPGLVGLELAGSLAVSLPGAVCWVGNDATAAVWAEHDRGTATGADDVVMVTLGTGIGGGVIAGGRLVEGANRYAGEIGHMVVDPHGPRCPCGKQGCWERYASGSGLGRLGREMAVAGQVPLVVALAGGDPEAVRGEHVTAAAASGDDAAAEVMSRFAWWLALGLANLANAFDPEVIVLGGGLIGAGEVLMGPTRRAFADLVEAAATRGKLRIEPAALGQRAGAVGAALLAAGNPSGCPGGLR